MPSRSKRRRKIPWGPISFMLAVVLPVAAVIAYYIFIAADQYKVQTRFAVRSTTPDISSGLLNSLGIGGGASVGDTYMVVEYIHSRELLAKLDEKLDLRSRFRRAGDDFYAALPSWYSMEDFLTYWRSMVQVHLDHTSNIITVSVFAFTPEDARDISKAILDESEKMINRISEQARRDAVWYAENEVAKAEKRLKEIRQRFLKFRDTTQQLDPTKQAQVQVSIIGKLEEELAKLKAKLAESRTLLSGNAPTVTFLQNRIKAIQQQIAAEKRKLGGGRLSSNRARNGNLSATLSEYEALVVEREFAEKLYLSALTSLEQARLLANRQQRYLATFVHPYLPDEALYPKRIRNTFFVFISLTLIWALGMLMLQSIRDRI